MADINKRNRIIKLLREKGYTLNQAKGIAANLYRESSFDTGAHNPNDPGEKGSRGLAQWNRGRLDTLQKMYGDEWTKLENQVDYIHWELNNTYKHVGKKLKNVNTVEEATALITREYEVPANMEREIKERIKIAKGYTDLTDDTFDMTADYTEENPLQTRPVEYIKDRVAIGDPQFNYQTNMGIISSAPDMSEEDKSEISKISIIQKQLEDLQKQMSEQPQVAQSPEPAPQVQQQTSQRPSRSSYLSNTDLFTIQGGLPEF